MSNFSVDNKASEDKTLSTSDIKSEPPQQPPPAPAPKINRSSSRRRSVSPSSRRSNSQLTKRETDSLSRSPSRSRSRSHSRTNSRSRSYTRSRSRSSRSRSPLAPPPSRSAGKYEGGESRVRVNRSRSPVHSRTYMRMQQQQQHHRAYDRDYERTGRSAPAAPGAAVVHDNDEMRINPPANNVLAVFGLDRRITEVALYDTFARYGCTECKLIIDKHTKMPRGYAFVYFSKVEDAIRARHKTNGEYLLSRPMRVDFSIGERDFGTSKGSLPVSSSSSSSSHNGHYHHPPPSSNHHHHSHHHSSAHAPPPPAPSYASSASSSAHHYREPVGSHYRGGGGAPAGDYPHRDYSRRSPIPNARYSSSDRAARFPDRQYVSRASPPPYAPTSYHHSSGSPADYARHNHHHHHPPAPPPPSSHHHHHPADPFYSSSRARRGDDAPYSVPRRYAGSPPPPSSSSSAPHHRLSHSTSMYEDRGGSGRGDTKSSYSNGSASAYANGDRYHKDYPPLSERREYRRAPGGGDARDMHPDSHGAHFSNGGGNPRYTSNSSSSGSNGESRAPPPPPRR